MGFLIARVFLYIFTPLFHFSSILRENGLDYMGGLFISMLGRIILTTILAGYSSVIFIINYAIDFILYKLWGINLGLSPHQAYIFTLWMTIGVYSLTILYEEYKLKSKGLLSDVLSEAELKKLGTHFEQEFGRRLYKKLRIANIHIDYTGQLTASTYGALLIRPRIIISSALMSESWAGCRRSVLLHEINHIERSDNFIRLLLCSIQLLLSPVLKLCELMTNWLGRLPFGKYLSFIFRLILNVWNTFIRFEQLLQRRSELFADTETYGDNPESYMILALSDLEFMMNDPLSQLPHYGMVDSEAIAYEVIQDEVTRSHFKIDGVWDHAKRFLSLNMPMREHPELQERAFWAATMSTTLGRDRNTGVKTISVPYFRYTVMIIVTIILIPLLLIMSFEIQKSFKYEFKEKAVLKYIKKLEKEIDNE